MIEGTKGLARVLVDMLLLVPIGCIALVGWWFFENVFLKSTAFVDAYTDKEQYTVGEVMSVEYRIVRYRDCRLEISRLMERTTDRREYQVQFLMQVIKADDPPFYRPGGYRVQVPLELTTGDYDVYSRVRYYCNGLDYLYPRYLITGKVRVRVLGLV